MAINWERIKRGFDKGRCIIMLGPKLATIAENGSKIPVEEVLSAHIADILEDNGIDYDKEARGNLFYIAQRFLKIENAEPIDLEDLVEDFYKERTKAIPTEYQAIAELPVQLVINTSPDDFMVRAFRKAKKRPIIRYYNFRGHANFTKEPDQEIFKGSIDRPIVYHLFGSLENTMSLVFTENDRLDFVRNIIQGNPPIPNKILSQFERGNTYLFLGFNVENWQYLLLLDAFKVAIGNKTISPKINGKHPSIATKTFFEERFKFSFVEHNVSEFIKALQQQIEEERQRKTYNIFIAFSDKDKEDLDSLDRAFDTMEKLGEINLWHRDLMNPGEKEEKIKTELEKADIILLLLSADFLALDDHSTQKELEWSVGRSRQKKDVILKPVIVRHCDWRNYPGLQHLEALPRNEAPINSASWNNKDEAYFHIVDEVRKLIRK